MKLKTGKSISVPAGLGLSLLGNIVISGISIAVLTALLTDKAISWEETGYWIMAILLLASFIGSKIAIVTIQTQKYWVSLMSGGLFWFFLLCITALFFGGQYSSVPETALLIISGSVAAALIHLPKNHISPMKKRHSYR